MNIFEIVAIEHSLLLSIYKETVFDFLVIAF
jgi:hypothetical protein